MTLESLVIGFHYSPVNMSLLLAHTEINVPSSSQSELVKIQPSMIIVDVAKMAGVMVTETLKGLRQNPASYPARDGKTKERMTPIAGRWWVEILDKLFTWMDETVL